MEKIIRLQGLGKFKANAASEIKVGDVLLWNFGEKSTVTKIVKQTEKSIWIEEKASSGKLYTRRFTKTRLVKIC